MERNIEQRLGRTSVTSVSRQPYCCGLDIASLCNGLQQARREWVRILNTILTDLETTFKKDLAPEVATPNGRVKDVGVKALACGG